MKHWIVIALGAAVALGIFAHRSAPATAPFVQTTAARQQRRAHPRRPPHQPAPTILVYVAGAVKRPGLYRFMPGARANDAIASAGGFTPQADPAAVNLAEPIQDGEEIHALRAGEALSRSRSTVRSSKRKKRLSSLRLTSFAQQCAASRRAAKECQAVDLNTADLSQLAALPGIGPTLAARIIAYRGQNGPFATLDELADVAGMTQRRVDAVTPFLFIH